MWNEEEDTAAQSKMTSVGTENQDVFVYVLFLGMFHVTEVYMCEALSEC